MDRLEWFLAVIDETLDTPGKRHIAGGILISISLLFGGLAVTVVTMKKEGDNENE